MTHDSFSSLPGLSLHGDSISVIKHLRIKRREGLDREEEKRRLNEVVLKVINRSICFGRLDLELLENDDNVF